MKSSTLGKYPILSATMFIPWNGAWILDAELDLSSTDPLPTGKVTPNLSDTALTGTVDARFTARFGEKAHARIVAGAGAWANDPGPKHFHSDAGLLSSTVITATANEIGETATQTTPITFPKDYMRLGVDPQSGKGRPSPASRVLDGFDWYVDATGITQVAPWPAATPSDDVLVLGFDAEKRRLDIAAASIVWPGTVFTDTRFSTMSARDVEIEITKDTFRITAWCAGGPSSRYQAVLRNQVREYAGVDFANVVRYRIKQINLDGRLYLDAVDPADGFPSTLPLDVWTGMAGFYADFIIGTEALVEFIDRNPQNPIVRGFAAPDVTKTSRVALAPPTQANFDAVVAFAAACGNAVNPQVSEIKAAAAALYAALTGAAGLPPATPPYAPSKAVQAAVGRAQ